MKHCSQVPSFAAWLACFYLVACEKEAAPNVALPKQTVVVSDRQDPLADLKRRLEDKSLESDIQKKDEAIALVRTLAEQKRVDAVPLLLENFMVIRPFSVPAGSGEFGGYPCLEALVSMGQRVLPQMEDRFFSALIPREQFLIFGALVEIRGSVQTAAWLDQLPPQGPRSLPAARREELRGYALSLQKPGRK